MRLEHAYQKLLEKLAAQTGYIPDQAYTPIPQPAPECAACNDLGWIKYDVKIDDPRFGKAYKCENCWLARNAARQLYNIETGAAGIPPKEAAFTFADFKNLPDEFKRHKMNAYNACLGLAEGIRPRNEEEGRDYPGVYLWGGNGVGKSTLATCALKGLAAQGRPVLWQDSIGLMAAIKDTFRAAQGNYSEPTAEKIIQNASHVAILLLDEFGDQDLDEKVSNFDRQTFYRVIDTRLKLGLTTIITSNLAPDQVADQFGKSTARRLFELCLAVKMEGLNPRNAKR